MLLSLPLWSGLVLDLQLEAFESEREERSLEFTRELILTQKSIVVVEVGGFCRRIIMELNIRVVSEQRCGNSPYVGNFWVGLVCSSEPTRDLVSVQATSCGVDLVGYRWSWVCPIHAICVQSSSRVRKTRVGG